MQLLTYLVCVLERCKGRGGSAEKYEGFSESNTDLANVYSYTCTYMCPNVYVCVCVCVCVCARTRTCQQGHLSCCLLLAHPLDGGHVANSGSGNTSTSTSVRAYVCIQDW